MLIPYTIDDFFTKINIDKDETTRTNLNIIRDAFKNIMEINDYKNTDETKAFNIIQGLDRLCMTSGYNNVVVLPSCIILEYYIDLIDINYLEAQQLVNDIKHVITNNMINYNMDLDILQEIIKDIYTSGLVDNSILEKYVMLSKFDNMRSFSTLMGGKDIHRNYSDMYSDVSKISLISNEVITKLQTGLLSGYSFDYNDICDIMSNYSKALIDNVNADIILKDFCFIISSVFDHILHVELNPNNEDCEILAILSLISKLSKNNKFNPIITTYRLCISNTLNIINNKRYKSQILDFNRYSLGIIQYSKYNEYNLELHDSLIELLNIILSDDYCSIELIEYMKEQPLQSNYFKELLNSKLSNVKENDLSLSYSLGVKDLPYTVSSLTEGFNILPNGNIQLMFDRESHPMDEYTNNHRLLKYNHKLGNFEGMKYNLVYLLILIEALEAKVIYNSKTSDSDKTEAKKVVRLCKGDLGVYLPIIQKNDKSFDLNKFYSQVKDESNTIEINTVDTITGIKMIIKTIL